MLRFYKIITDNNIIDVITSNEDRFVRNIEPIGILRGQKLGDAEGVISSDGQFIWQIKDRPKLPGKLSIIELQEILTVEEYNDLKNRLELETIIKETPEEMETENEEKIMSTIETRNKIMELTNTIDELNEKNNFLEQCLMEISEVIYA